LFEIKSLASSTLGPCDRTETLLRQGTVVECGHSGEVQAAATPRTQETHHLLQGIIYVAYSSSYNVRLTDTAVPVPTADGGYCLLAVILSLLPFPL
jgi:hypothetical protein